MERANRKIICALDTHDLGEALQVAKNLVPYVGAFKVGHALTLNYGLDVVDRLRDVGVDRVFLDLKFHDIPNSVALAVCEASRRGVWMMTLHLAGGPAMIHAAVEETKFCEEHKRPLLVGVSVLTSLDQSSLTNYLGVERSIADQMAFLSKMGMEQGLDGVVCSSHELSAIRHVVGAHGVIVTPGIRLPDADNHDQKRVGDAISAIKGGADYLVIGRALTNSTNVVATLAQFGLIDPAHA
jgi:orotidine-5'-phosphate decarboxylase